MIHLTRCILHYNCFHLWCFDYMLYGCGVTSFYLSKWSECFLQCWKSYMLGWVSHPRTPGFCILHNTSLSDKLNWDCLNCMLWILKKTKQKQKQKNNKKQPDLINCETKWGEKAPCQSTDLMAVERSWLLQLVYLWPHCSYKLGCCIWSMSES